MRLLAAAALMLAPAPYHSSIRPLPAPLKAELTGPYWRSNCPVSLSQLRLLTVRHWGFDGRPHTGQLVVHEDAAAPLSRVFRRLYELRFQIHHLRLEDMYDRRSWPDDGDVTASFECRQAVRSPCSGAAAGTGSWSNHAYGLAVDLNPVENPYVGCGQTRDPEAVSFMDRTRHRRGMVTRAVIDAFASIGWEWGGDWSGNTKDYMHFSHNGH
ncbi:MAG TPA: M15 family metallopeptidase [Gaiellaceae bacterium]|jgi:hypothetical protein